MNLIDELIMTDQNHFSVIIPVFNEEETLPTLQERLVSNLGRVSQPWEVVLVDDGSKDRSLEMMRDIHNKDGRFKIVSFSRNFGHQVAISAGLDFCSGRFAIIMDADLQDPPEVIPEMIKKWNEGYHIVYGVRRKRQGETIFKKITATMYYRLLQKLVTFDLPIDAGDFRLVDRKAIDAIKTLRERNRYVRGLFSWIGFKHCGVLYDRSERFAGETKYPLSKMLKLALDGVISFSNLPLRLVMRIGFTMAFASMVGGIAALMLKVFGGYVVRGWTSMVLFLSFTSGIQFMVLGVIGEYIARISDEVKQRPLYVINEKLGLK